MDWKNLVGSVSPILATALGGPLAGAAVKIIADKVLGNPAASEDEVATALSTGALTGEQVLALKQADQTFALEMAKLEQAAADAAIADTGNARQQTISLAAAGSAIAWGAPIVSTMIVGGYFVCVWLLFARSIDMPDNVFQLVNVMFGALSAALAQTINYWLGSSAGSKKSGDAIREIAVQQSKK